MRDAAGWAPMPALYRTEETMVIVQECENCIIVDAIHTVTVYTGAVYDPDDGLPIAYEGERDYGDGRLFPSGAAQAADAFQGRLDATDFDT